MKTLLSALFLISFSIVSFAQVEIPATSNKPVFEGPKSNSGGLPSILLREAPRPDYKLKDDPTKPKPIEMRTKNDLLSAGDFIENKWAEDEKPEKGFGEDQYLGDFKTTGKFVELYCRDDQYVDGDKIRVRVNGVVIQNSITLGSNWTPILVTLEKGFNTIEFEALNQGSSGPNTAAFSVINEMGETINSNRWNLLTGSKASMIIVKE
ncbi:hypothetical protein [Gillisia limnaea]|uniref:Secreted protein n=1 Tax=Gillisia limnaea (strain DSM 15749 / LMG 21470 / R-8282) TaxID=865937 RepID=H2BYM6_GILLR|nr:hypothetical protein [Gillisia limnaea]EHQ01147.1 secreted protein [Gillisia limnaea DSM 15749]